MPDFVVYFAEVLVAFSLKKLHKCLRNVTSVKSLFLQALIGIAKQMVFVTVWIALEYRCEFNSSTSPMNVGACKKLIKDTFPFSCVT